jgi:hypothetical protein
MTNEQFPVYIPLFSLARLISPWTSLRPLPLPTSHHTSTTTTTTTTTQANTQISRTEEAHQAQVAASSDFVDARAINHYARLSSGAQKSARYVPASLSGTTSSQGEMGVGELAPWLPANVSSWIRRLHHPSSPDDQGEGEVDPSSILTSHADICTRQPSLYCPGEASVETWHAALKGVKGVYVAWGVSETLAPQARAFVDVLRGVQAMQTAETARSHSHFDSGTDSLCWSRILRNIRVLTNDCRCRRLQRRE